VEFNTANEFTLCERERGIERDKENETKRKREREREKVKMSILRKVWPPLQKLFAT
jgi:hypothetical protein